MAVERVEVWLSSGGEDVLAGLFSDETLRIRTSVLFRYVLG